MSFFKHKLSYLCYQNLLILTFIVFLVLTRYLFARSRSLLCVSCRLNSHFSVVMIFVNDFAPFDVLATSTLPCNLWPRLMIYKHNWDRPPRRHHLHTPNHRNPANLPWALSVSIKFSPRTLAPELQKIRKNSFLLCTFWGGRIRLIWRSVGKVLRGK